MFSFRYNLEDVFEACEGIHLILHYKRKWIKSILIDSRNISSIDGVIFIAISGSHHNGHDYIESLFESGIRNFIVEQLPSDKIVKHSNIIVVENAIMALQKIAAWHRAKFKYPIIGITGSNGKTICKEWLNQLLESQFDIVRSPRSFNSQIGVPLSILQMNDTHTLGVFEAGISKINEMQNLEPILLPEIGIFTHLGQAHSENFNSPQEIVEEKIQLFEHADVIIYPFDNEIVSSQIKKRYPNRKLIGWGHAKGADLKVNMVSSDENNSLLEAIYDGKEKQISIPFTDEASIENALSCWSVLLHLSINEKEIQDRMAGLQSISMRLELSQGINQCTIINDSYNNDLGSLTVAVNFLIQQTQNHKKTLILSDIYQSGLSENQLYNEVSKLINDNVIHRFIGIGDQIYNQSLKFEGDALFFKNTADFIQEFSIHQFQNETILLKGARKFEFERIAKLLQQQLHQSVLEVNLNSLIDNFNFYRAQLSPNCKSMAMVKAFSYGSGSVEIANELQFHGVDYMAVAYADEGVELRKAGIHTPIMVMNPEIRSVDQMIRNDLEPEIYSLHILHQVCEAIDKSFQYITSPVKIHIKLDTGMHRLGFLSHEVDTLIAILKNNLLLQVESVFSHLAASENEDFDEFSNSQIELLGKAHHKIEKELEYTVKKHILNSAGIIRFPEAQFDMIRIGIGLYGIADDSSINQQLKSVSTFKSIVSQVKSIRKGETVGYGRAHKVEQDTKIAIIPVGYADGISRKLGHGKGYVTIKGIKAPYIGNICMDMSMVDLKGASIKAGDEVIIFGQDPNIFDFSQWMETIPYEVLTSVSRRIRRVYTKS